MIQKKLKLNINLKKITNTNFMFYNCSSLESIDLSTFNKSNVNNMGGMFSYCSFLFSIDLSSFNTSNEIVCSIIFLI